MFSEETKEKAREAYGHRHDRPESRIPVLETKFNHLKKDWDTQQKALRRKYVDQFLDFQVADDETTKAIEELCEQTIITMEPNQEEIATMLYGRHPLLDEPSSIRGDATSAEIVQHGRLTTTIEGAKKNLVLPASNETSKTWNGMFDLSKSFRAGDFIRQKSKFHTIARY